MVTISAQHNGPERSGNGGYVAGMLGAQLVAGHGADVVESTLRMPPPLQTPLTWEWADGVVRLVTAGGAVIGEARPGAFVDAPPAPPSAEEAAAGLQGYPGFHTHPFDRCFTCGTAREEGDGLRLFTGPTGDGRVAGPWTPHAAFGGPDGALDVPTTWAALDCPGGWAADFTIQPVVLGRMTAQVVRAPRAGEALRSVGLLRERDGRKFRTATALYVADDELLGRAEQVWIQIDLSQFS